MASLKKRGNSYQIQYYVGSKQRRMNLGKIPLQIAKEKLRQFESARARGLDNPLPSRTPLAEVLTAYVKHLRAHKTPKSAQNDIYYLREAFGPICDALCITSRAPSAATRKRKPKFSQVDGRKHLPVIEAATLEELSPSQIGAFIDFKVRDQGLKPKTANHYRSIIRRLINWAVETELVRMPNSTNPASRIRPYKEQAPEIRFQTLQQIDEQLHALRFNPKLQTMVAVLIYAGLRREELIWLTLDDIDLRRRHGGNGVLRVRAKTIGGRFWQPKTRSNRAIPISRQLRHYLDKYNPQASDVGWYFPSPGGRWWDPDNFSADLREANKTAGLFWTCLDYRHTFGSQLAQNGVSLYKISTLMGNSPEVCRRHYAAVFPDSMMADVEFARSDTSITTTISFDMV